MKYNLDELKSQLDRQYDAKLKNLADGNSKNALKNFFAAMKKHKSRKKCLDCGRPNWRQIVLQKVNHNAED